MLPEPIKQRQKRQFLQRTGLRLATSMLVLLFLIVFTFQGVLQKRQRYLRSLEKELHQLEPHVSAMASMQRDLEVLHKRLRQSADLLEAMRTLYETIPSTISVTFLSIETDRISFRGISQEIPQVFSFAEALENSKEFEKVQVKSTSQRRLQDREVIDFRIDALLATTEASQ